MNKVNLCWVFGDGRKGHEIQSLTLASHIAEHVELFRFSIRQPWLSLTPRLLPYFGRNILWKNTTPCIDNAPKVIITCGKRAAAVGKYYKIKLAEHNKDSQHFQILNPNDKPENYDLLITPAHDKVFAENVIETTGSIHPVNQSWLEPHKTQWNEKFKHITQPILAIMLGNPGEKYFKSFAKELNNIRVLYNSHHIFVCGSRRISTNTANMIRKLIHTNESVWLNNDDGINPYTGLLAHANHFLVTTDSINMISECIATQRPVSLLAVSYASKKHHRFIDSIADRLCQLGSKPDLSYEPVNSLNELLTRISLFQNLSKSPDSSN
ncbi:MAG: mitochondrial fission ELM1 family protein [Proteobacteria bacterium]|nr:mitochondrial fission ELM1 family protein [Pseudomonadota bacterium]